MTPQEQEALQTFEDARNRLIVAFDALREARGQATHQPCPDCQDAATEAGSGGQKEQCDTCHGSRQIRRSFPWIVTDVEWGRKALEPSLFNRDTTWVSVRPCGEEFQGKTYLGWLLGDLALSQMANLRQDGTLCIRMAGHNPAIFVPELGRIIYGAESWWAAIKRPDDLRKISDADIENVWYVKALKDIAETRRQNSQEVEG